MQGGPARLFRVLADRSKQEAIAFEGESWSFDELDRAAIAWAASLRDQGVKPGDRVAALAPSSPDLIAAMLGTYRCGAIWTPINTRYREAEIGHILEDCAPQVILVDEALRDRVAQTANVQTLRPPELSSDTSGAPQVLSDTAGALLIYTSGTTGRSKGALLSHAAVLDGIGALTHAWGWTADDVLSLQLPLFHVHGLCIGVHGALLAGMSVRLHAKFSAASVVADVRQGATVFMGVPTMYTRLLEHLDEHPHDGEVLGQARLFTAGSAALPAADLEAYARHTGHRIVERYGMSETLITFTNPLDAERRAGSVGLEVPGVRARVVDEAGREVEAGARGELHVQTPAMMSEYWRNESATRAAFDGPWFRTGDVVSRDADGYVRIVGRMSVDIIKSGGFKISAREIEEALLEHSAVLEVAVVGMPDATWGERIEAAVVLAERLDDVSATLGAHVAERLADYKRPRVVHVVDALPRNALGKLQKVVLKRSLQTSR